MTLIDAVTALILLGVFLSGFSQAFLPAYNCWNEASAEYNTAHTIQFVAESFRLECAKPNPNIESWKAAAAAAKELESYTITELWHGEELFALKAACVISGECIEIIGVCMP